MSWQEPPPSAHLWTIDLKMSCLIHVCMIKVCPSNNVECEVLPLSGDQGGSSAVLQLSD